MSGYFVRTETTEPDVSTTIAIPSKNFCAQPSSDEDTAILAWIRTSGSACVPMWSPPWLCSTSSRCPGWNATVFENSRS
jgi:hypothetical protein